MKTDTRVTSKEPLHLTEGVAGPFRAQSMPCVDHTTDCDRLFKVFFYNPLLDKHRPILGMPFRVGRNHKMRRHRGCVKLDVKGDMKLGRSSMAYLQTFLFYTQGEIGENRQGDRRTKCVTLLIFSLTLHELFT